MILHVYMRQISVKIYAKMQNLLVVDYGHTENNSLQRLLLIQIIKKMKEILF